jgi:chromosome segregation ATPase
MAIMKRIKCVREGKYAIIPSDGDSIVYVKKGHVDEYPVEFAHRVLKTGSFIAVGKDDKPSVDVDDLNATIAGLEEREQELEDGQKKLAEDRSQLDADKAEFEQEKQEFADKVEAFADDIDPDDEDDEKDPETDPAEDDEDPAEKSVEDLCNDIVANSKDEDDAKKQLIEFADARVGLELNMRFSAKTMIERIVEADAENDGE